MVCYQYRKERLIIPGIKGQYNKGKYPYEEYHKYIDSVLYKKCAYHHELFPNEDHWFPCTEEYYYKNIHNKSDGLQPECKRCSSLKSSKRIKNNIKGYKKYKKLHYIENKDRIIKRTMKSRNKNKEYYSQQGKNYRQTDIFKEKNKEYSKKRQEKKHIITNIEWENCKQYFDNKCAYCGLPIEKHYRIYAGKLQKIDLHKEHVIDDGKNDIRNCIPACNSCNTQKNKKSLNNWYNSNNQNYTYERYLKICQWIRYDHKKFIMPKKKQKKI